MRRPFTGRCRFNSDWSNFGITPVPQLELALHTVATRSLTQEIFCDVTLGGFAICQKLSEFQIVFQINFQMSSKYASKCLPNHFHPNSSTCIFCLGSANLFGPHLETYLCIMKPPIGFWL